LKTRKPSALRSQGKGKNGHYLEEQGKNAKNGKKKDRGSVSQKQDESTTPGRRGGQKEREDPSYTKPEKRGTDGRKRGGGPLAGGKEKKRGCPATFNRSLKTKTALRETFAQRSKKIVRRERKERGTMNPDLQLQNRKEGTLRK